MRKPKRILHIYCPECGYLETLNHCIPDVIHSDFIIDVCKLHMFCSECGGAFEIPVSEAKIVLTEPRFRSEEEMSQRLKKIYKRRLTKGGFKKVLITIV